jgi:phosphoribosylaminoimidazolecarboxamide formyltransferase/IMP cyclohydrolase
MANQGEHMRTALVSVSDKTGLVEFIHKLKELDGLSDLRIISTSSTSKFLKENKIDCIPIEDVTKFPEMLDGRVKTLHPVVFAGILARGTDEDRKTLQQHNIDEIDFVIVNLYPFEKKLAEKLSEPEMVEQVDIGGPSLLRAAAKNFKRMVVACQPSQYDEIVDELKKNKGQTTFEFRRKLAYEVYKFTAHYDTVISGYFAKQVGGEQSESENTLPDNLKLSLAQFQQLRYGENPHQAAVWYSDGRFGGNQIESFPPFEQLQGKELSSNNITDTYCLVNILRDIGTPACCIIKHNNPCGVAVGKDLEDAYQKAHSTDPDAAFGGIFGFTDTVDAPLATKITEGFVEIVAAPTFTDEAMDVFKKKKNVRVLKLKSTVLKPAALTSWHMRDLQDFGWIIEKDVEPPVQLAQFQCVSGESLGGEHIVDAAFSWAVVKHLTSNAIFIAKDGKSLGFGIGQTSRIASVRIALNQAGEAARGAVMASDAFFPAIDNIEAAAKAGIEVIIQPGGSIKDKEVIEACDKAGIKMLFTGQRVFKH